MMMKLHFKIGFIFLLLSLTLNVTGMVVDSLESPRLWLTEQNIIGQELLEKNQEFSRAVSVFKSAHDFADAQNLLDEFVEIMTTR